MMLANRTQELASTLALTPFVFSIPKPSQTFLPASLSLLYRRPLLRLRLAASSFSASPETLVLTETDLPEDNHEPEERGYGSLEDEARGFVAENDMKHLDRAEVEVKELAELPEQWRRAKIAWLCKELPAHKPGTLVRLLNAQRKWVRQEDATYIAVHCMRIRENETAFRVYKWMIQHHWYRFDFALATKLADYLGKEGKFAKCHEIFDDIINQGRVPSESTFHVLICAYLNGSLQGCLDEACSIYNRMIQLGGYQPRLSLHNALFKAIVSKPGRIAKHYLKQAEFIFHNLETFSLKIHKDIYGGLIWLHSYQSSIDRERIMSLRKEMEQAGIAEGPEVLVSLLRACSKEGDLEEADNAWIKLLGSDISVPSRAYVYKMEVHAKVGEHMKSFEVFRDMQKHEGSASVAGYHKIIEVLCKAREDQLAESLMEEFVATGKNPLTPAYINLMDMYLDLGFYDKVELFFFHCLNNGQLNPAMFNIYLRALVRAANIGKAEEIFYKMKENISIGINSVSCNAMLGGYLSSEDYSKAEKVYHLMCQKRFEVESQWMEKLDHVLSLSRNDVKRPVLTLKLTKEQREILVGLLMGGLKIESDEKRKRFMLLFEFNENSATHSFLKRHIYAQFYEWLHPSYQTTEDTNALPNRLSTISHTAFAFYEQQFQAGGQPIIPKLIHRWLSPCVLAYWYLYGGQRTSSGDILLKLKGNRDGVGRVVKGLKAKSVICRVKRKGKVFWIGLLGTNASLFYELIEPCISGSLRDVVKPDGHATAEPQSINFDGGSESESEFDERITYYGEGG